MWHNYRLKEDSVAWVALRKFRRNMSTSGTVFFECYIPKYSYSLQKYGFWYEMKPANILLCNILLTWTLICYTPLGNASPNFFQHLPGFSAYKSVVTNKRWLKYLSLMYVQKKNEHGSGLNNVAVSDVPVANRTVSTQQQRGYVCWKLRVFSRPFVHNFVFVFLTNNRPNPDVAWRIRTSEMRRCVVW